MILVTGASGTVGREVASRLSGRTPVRLGLRDPSRVRATGTTRFDFLDPSSFGPALSGVDRVFLLRPPQLVRARQAEPWHVAGFNRVIRQIALRCNR